MERTEIIERISEVTSEQLGIDAEKVVADASFIDDLGADSLDIVELVMAFEDEFEISIPDTVVEKIKTVSQAADLILEQKAA